MCMSLYIIRVCMCVCARVCACMCVCVCVCVCEVDIKYSHCFYNEEGKCVKEDEIKQEEIK